MGQEPLRGMIAVVVAGLVDIVIGSPHVFVWRYEGSHVDLAGDFTEWGKNKLPMKRLDDNHFYLGECSV